MVKDIPQIHITVEMIRRVEGSDTHLASEPHRDDADFPEVSDTVVSVYLSLKQSQS